MGIPLQWWARRRPEPPLLASACVCSAEEDVVTRRDDEVVTRTAGTSRGLTSFDQRGRHFWPLVAYCQVEPGRGAKFWQQQQAARAGRGGRGTLYYPFFAAAFEDLRRGEGRLVVGGRAKQILPPLASTAAVERAHIDSGAGLLGAPLCSAAAAAAGPRLSGRCGGDEWRSRLPADSAGRWWWWWQWFAAGPAVSRPAALLSGLNRKPNGRGAGGPVGGDCQSGGMRQWPKLHRRQLPHAARYSQGVV